MAQVEWWGNGGGSTYNVTSGKDLTMTPQNGGVPSGATVTSVVGRYGFSQQQYNSTSETWQVYFTKQDSTVFFNGSPYAEENITDTASGSVSTTGTWAPAGHGVSATFSDNLQWFVGKNAAYTFKVYAKSTTTGTGSTALLRSTVFRINYYIACTNPSNVSGSSPTYKQLTGTWTKGANGTDDTCTTQICYNTSKTWNSSTASTTTGTSKTWTGLSAGTYYVGVRSVGSASGNHTAVWSGAITVEAMAKPTVSSGEIIYKDKMDLLKAYIEKGTAVTQESVIEDTIGNSYRANSASEGDVIYATWFTTTTG